MSPTNEREGLHGELRRTWNARLCRWVPEPVPAAGLSRVAPLVVGFVLSVIEIAGSSPIAAATVGPTLSAWSQAETHPATAAA